MENLGFLHQKYSALEIAGMAHRSNYLWKMLVMHFLVWRKQMSLFGFTSERLLENFGNFKSLGFRTNPDLGI